MNRNLYILAFLLFLLAGIVIFKKERKKVQNVHLTEIKSEVLKEKNSFRSKLHEPYDNVLCRRFIHVDFTADRYLTVPQIKDHSAVHILSIESEVQLDSFHLISDKLINLEALMVYNVTLDVEHLIKLIDKLEPKAHLQKLIFNSCRIHHVPTSIRKLKYLKAIDFTHNNIKSLPNEICELEKLNYLRINSDDSFEKLPSNLGKLKNLEVLDFAGTKVSTIPVAVGECLKLIHITGNGSRVKTIPGEIKNCKNLRFINLGHNQIGSIPKEIGELRKLTHLTLGSNHMSKLPSEFRNLTNLGLCNLSQNKFNVFPNEVLNLKKLYTLTLYENNFNRIPYELTNLKKLRVLYVDIDEISKVDIDEIRDKLPNLKIKEVNKK